MREIFACPGETSFEFVLRGRAADVGLVGVDEDPGVINLVVGIAADVVPLVDDDTFPTEPGGELLGGDQACKARTDYQAIDGILGHGRGYGSRDDVVHADEGSEVNTPCSYVL